MNNYLPSSADLGVDLVESLFEVDVLQTIEQLRESINDLPIVELQNEVTLQLEMLVGFSEMTGLSGLKGIAIEILENLWKRILGELGSENFSEFLRIYWNSCHKLVRKAELFKTI